MNDFELTVPDLYNKNSDYLLSSAETPVVLSTVVVGASVVVGGRDVSCLMRKKHRSVGEIGQIPL